MIKHSPVDSPESLSPPPSDILSPDQEASSDAQMRSGALIGWILQGGVMLSAVVIVIGLLLEALRPDKFAPQKLQFFPQTFEQVWTGLLILRPQAVIAFGLFLLIATPVVRVAASIVAFAVERDRRFVVVTALVLLILLFSIFYSKVQKG